MWYSQNEEELLIDSRDAGDDAEHQYHASKPHMYWFQEFTYRDLGAGQEEANHTKHPLDGHSQTQGT